MKKGIPLSTKDVGEKLYLIRNQLKFSGFKMSELIEDETGKMVEIENLKEDFQICIYVRDFIHETVDAAVELIKGIADPNSIDHSSVVDIDEDEIDNYLKQMKIEDDENFQ